MGQQLAAWKAYPQVRSKLSQIGAGPPILVTGAHRSGTTWIGSMLAASGIWHVHEPTAPYQSMWNEWYSYAPASHPDAALNRLIAEVLGGRHRKALNMRGAQHPLMPLRWLPQPVHRVLIKDPIASLASESLAQVFAMQVLVVFRHPGAFVESVSRLGWPSANLLVQFRNNSRLMKDWLEPQAHLLERGVSECDPATAAAVLHGCLCKILWGYTQRNANMRAIQYEEAAAAPLPYFQALFASLGLDYTVDVERAHQQLSAGANGAARYHPHAVHRRSQTLVAAWKSRLAPDVQADIRQIWSSFEVPLYVTDSEW